MKDYLCIEATTARHFYALARGKIQMARYCMEHSGEERVEDRDGWLEDARRCRAIARRLREAEK
jgi:hypothetical protein